MRKIISKYKKDKKKKQNGMIIGLILVGVMLFSVLGYSFQGKENNDEKKLNYNDFEFIEQNGFWFTNVENLQFAFRYNPQQVEEINSKGEFRP
ncbi:unnamed protein product, partial [marine sediment metagenome]